MQGMKRKNSSFWAGSLVACLTIGGCATKQQSGAVIGAGAGALAGSAIARGHASGAIVGGMLGALLGSEVGRQMDAADQAQLTRVLEAAPTHQPTAWVNPDSGNSYRVTPVRTYTQASSGAPCREFRMFGDVGAREQEIYGTACRQPDGSWRIVQTQPVEGIAGY
jgi:surface antigen